MKKFTLLLFLLLHASLSAQTNFLVENNILKWQQIYNDSTSTNTILINLKQNGFDAYETETTIDFNNTFSNQDLKNIGMKWSSFPAYIQTGGNYSGFIEVKPDKVRVTITKIHCTDDLEPTGFMALQDFVVKKSELKTSKNHQKALNLLDTYFNNLFLTITKKSNW